MVLAGCQCSGTCIGGLRVNGFLSTFSSSICVVWSVDQVTYVLPLWVVLVSSFCAGDEFHETFDTCLSSNYFLEGGVLS